MSKPTSVAVIGAGIAGIACAATLKRAGFRVRVFDKGRDLGGRMATRRVNGWQWDHGTQLLRGDDPDFSRLIEALPGWRSGGLDLGKVGAPTQNQLVKTLAADLDVVLATRVTELARSDRRWQLHADRPIGEERYDAVVVAVPAPQARGLLPASAVFAPLAHVRIQPCWALMVATPEALDVPVAMACPHEHIAWCAADHSKPGRPSSGGQYVLHATAAWSERHLEASTEEAGAALLADFQALFGPVEVSYAVAHRWRYALTDTPLQQPYVLDTANRIGACGDWCLGARVEHGFLSGRGLGLQLAEHLTS